ncbi:MAG: NAD(P)H-dependent oxidoreductase [Thiobacillus sp.]|nr:NAD(P)H-dependent oxidoreductase [Thiobacillus sp.]
MKPHLLDAIQQRYACREFIADQPVSTHALALLLEAGRLAPSAFGLEPWRFVTVTGTAEKTALAHACFDQPAATSAAAFIVVIALVDKLDPDSDYVRARFEAEARDQDVAPIHAAYRHFYHADSIAAWAQGQCNYAAAHMLLQAAHLGIGSCPIGGFDADALATILSVETGEIPTLVIALGHCRHVAPERVRKPLEPSS